MFIADEQAMEALGNRIGKLLQSGDILYLCGTLGAGKTTLTRGVLQGMGYAGRVTSPTFTLMNIYPASPPVFHFDFYRLESNELYELGLDDYLGQEGVSIVEWAEIGADLLPPEALWVYILLKDEDYDLGRVVSFEARSPAAHLLMERLQEYVDPGY